MTRSDANEPIGSLMARATSMARAGERDGAAALWRQVIEREPGNAGALNALGNWHLSRGEAAQARALLDRAVAADPGQPALLFNLAAAARAAGDLPAALAALDGALAADPYFVQAMFQKAVLLEDAGQARAAAQTYRHFLDTAPPEVKADPRFAEPLRRANEAVAADNARLEQLVGRRTAAPSRRTQEAIDALLGKGRIHVSQPTFLAVPRLPAIPFFDRELTPWLADVEAAAPAIIEEARSVIAADAASAGFVPYVANPPGTPLNQWRELDHSPDWGALFFWKHGARNEANCARCPATAALLDRMPMPRLARRAPNAMFSLLRPGTRIPPHTGVTNLRSTVHLPLVVPDGCGFRVGAETRTWRPGEAWVFDDTIEHEAWNDSDADRLILIFDVWNPFISPDEQLFLAELLAAHADYYGRVEGLTDTL